ncbi:hypothetical protein [Gillisia limnaea]|nr:hypothetical protein [Gillisia limnaea]
MLSITNSHLNDYLYFGYIPELGSIKSILQLPNSINSILNKLSESSLIKKGGDILDFVFDEELSKCANANHVIPISGGLDSRVILSSLLKRVDTSNIQLVTFGSPYTSDYEIPKK